MEIKRKYHVMMYTAGGLSRPNTTTTICGWLLWNRNYVKVTLSWLKCNLPHKQNAMADRAYVYTPGWITQCIDKF